MWIRARTYRAATGRTSWRYRATSRGLAPGRTAYFRRLQRPRRKRSPSSVLSGLWSAGFLSLRRTTRFERSLRRCEDPEGSPGRATNRTHSDRLLTPHLAVGPVSECRDAPIRSPWQFRSARFSPASFSLAELPHQLAEPPLRCFGFSPHRQRPPMLRRAFRRERGSREHRLVDVSKQP